jgi:hypothetical protein
MKPLVVFSHGKESGPWGAKITFLANIAKQLGAEVVSPDYTGIASPDDRVAFLLDIPEIAAAPTVNLVMVGSSMGGYVSCVASESLRPTGLFLLAPAIGLDGYRLQNPVPGTDNVEIVMGWQDELIPVSNVINFALRQKARLHLINGDHRLNSALVDVGFLFQGFLQRCFENAFSQPDE